MSDLITYYQFSAAHSTMGKFLRAINAEYLNQTKDKSLQIEHEPFRNIYVVLKEGRRIHASGVRGQEFRSQKDVFDFVFPEEKRIQQEAAELRQSVEEVEGESAVPDTGSDGSSEQTVSMEGLAQRATRRRL